MSDWSQQLAEELHKPITRNFRKRRVISYGVDKIWAADLVEIQKYSKWNKGIKCLLTVIDVFSKYGWIETLKDKKTESVSSAFEHKSVNENQKSYGLIKVVNLLVNILKIF